MKKFVYAFKEGNATMRNLLGGKGANLAEMTSLGLPIPQGFTVSTDACTEYYNCGKNTFCQKVRTIVYYRIYRYGHIVICCRGTKENHSG